MDACARWSATLLLLPPAAFGVFCAGGIAGAVIGVAPSLTASVALATWILCIVIAGTR